MRLTVYCLLILDIYRMSRKFTTKWYLPSVYQRSGCCAMVSKVNDNTEAKCTCENIDVFSEVTTGQQQDRAKEVSERRLYLLCAWLLLQHKVKPGAFLPQVPYGWMKLKWSNAIKLKDFIPGEHYCVCSLHFQGGKKMGLTDVPAIFPLLLQPKFRKPPREHELLPKNDTWKKMEGWRECVQ